MIKAPFDRETIPHKPGVYIFKDSRSKVIYVGKAIDLFSRVSSYFREVIDTPKTASLVENIHDCQTIEVESELEALILEANLIKKYLPPYNIRLTDDKDYLYIKITNELFPRIITARKKETLDAKWYFGPFPSSTNVRNTLKRLRRIFPWCSNPYALRRPCFYYHLGLCPGPCAEKISRKDYLKIIKNFSKFMQGKKTDLVKNLIEEMGRLSSEQKFEQASQIKKTLDGINYLTQPNKTGKYLENPNFIDDQNKQSIQSLKKDLNLKVVPQRIECYDISNFGGKDAVGSLVVLTCGDIDKRWYRRFKIHQQTGKPDDYAMMREMLSRRLKHKDWPMPDLMIIDGGIGQVKAAQTVLEKFNLSIPLFGLAKKMEWLYSPDRDIIKLPKASLSLRALQKIRDEAHRFAVNYHRKLRGQSLWLAT